MLILYDIYLYFLFWSVLFSIQMNSFKKRNVKTLSPSYNSNLSRNVTPSLSRSHFHEQKKILFIYYISVLGKRKYHHPKQFITNKTDKSPPDTPPVSNAIETVNILYLEKKLYIMIFIKTWCYSDQKCDNNHSPTGLMCARWR